MNIPKFGLNRHNTSSVSAFTADVIRAEKIGWDCAFLPDSPLRLRDNYVLLSGAAQATKTITIGPLLTNPITRHPSVTASSIATVAELAPNRTILGLGVGDTAVRLAGLKPARVKELEQSVHIIKSLLAGKEVEVGAVRPAKLPFPQNVPVWLAAGGPKTLEMAGSCADGVFIRVGTDIKNIKNSVNRIKEGAIKSGLDPSTIKLGAIFHTVFCEDEDDAMFMGKSMAAGYYEYSPMLIENLNIPWNGPHPDELKNQGLVWPDFHHAADLIQSGKAVDFISENLAKAFCLMGGTNQITNQIVQILKECMNIGIEFEYVVLHPIPNPPIPDNGPSAYLERIPKEVLSRVKKILTKQ